MLILDDARRHPVVIGEALLKLIGNLSDLRWLWLRWAHIKNQRWLIRHQVGVFVFYCLQLHRLLVVVLDGYSGRSHASVDIGDYLRYFLHIAFSESEVVLAALVDHGQVSVHVLWAARSLAARPYLARRHPLLARLAILLCQGLIARERLHSGHGARAYVLDLEELFQVVLGHPIALPAVMVVIHTGFHSIIAFSTLLEHALLRVLDV